MEELRGSLGSAFLDVLVAILIGSASLLIVFGGIGLAARTGARTRVRALQVIAERNERAANRPVQFVEEILR